MIVYDIKEHIRYIKNVAAEKQMYDLFLRIGILERKLSSYNNDDSIDDVKLIELLQDCLFGLSEYQSFLIKQIIRELKLKQIL